MTEWGGVMRGTVMVLLAAQGAGCSVVRHIDTPAAYIRSEGPGNLRLTKADGSTVTLDRPRAEGDSAVTGWIGLRQFVRLRVADIRHVDVRTKAPIRTALLTGSIAAAVVTVAARAHGDGPLAEDDRDPNIDTFDLTTKPAARNVWAVA